MAKRFTEEQHKQWQATLPKKIVGAKVIVRSDKGNVLLVKPDYKDTWQLPGGGVEANEDPKLAATRETQEETNIEIETRDLQLIDSIFRTDEDSLVLIFECTTLFPEDADYNVEDEEIEEYRFVDPAEVAGLLSGYYAEFWKNYVSQI